MGDYCKELHSDCREPSWPSGLYRRGDSFRFRRMVGGRPVIDVWGRIPLEDAIRRVTRYNLDLHEGRLPTVERARRETTVAAFVHDVWLKKKATELRPRSLARYKAVAELFIEYLEKVKGLQPALLGAIGYDIAADYLAHRATAPLMPNGQRKFTRAITHGASKKTVLFDRETLFQLFKEAVRRDLVKENPFADLHPRKPTVHEVRAVHHPLTVEEEARLLAAAAAIDAETPDKGNPRFRDIVLFLVRTGLRHDEMCSLEWTDIDWKDGLINVRLKQVEESRAIPIPPPLVPALKRRMRGKSPGEPVFSDGDIEAFAGRLHIRGRQELLSIKAGEVDLSRMRIVARRSYAWKPKGTNGAVPMCKEVRALLEGLAGRKTSNFVFPHRDGGPCRMDLLALLKKAQKRAGIGGRLRIHDLRHTLGRRLRKDLGVPLETIMGILRHADIRETLIYAPYSLDEGRAAMGKLDGIAAPIPSTR